MAVQTLGIVLPLIGIAGMLASVATLARKLTKARKERFMTAA